jgi:hypothetical protein
MGSNVITFIPNNSRTENIYLMGELQILQLNRYMQEHEALLVRWMVRISAVLRLFFSYLAIVFKFLTCSSFSFIISCAKSSSSLSCDRSMTSSKLSSPKNAILRFLLQLPVSYFESSNSCLHLLPRLLVPLIFPSMMWLRRQFLRNVCPIQLAFVLLCEECSFPPLLCVILLHYLRCPSNLSSPPFSSNTFQNFPGTSDLVSEESKFPHHTKLCSKCGTSLVSSLALSLICWWREASSCCMLCNMRVSKLPRNEQILILWICQDLAHVLQSTYRLLLILTRLHLEVSVARKYYSHV